jgi:hypothetical protein
VARADLRGADLRDCSFGEAGGITSLEQAKLWSVRLDGAYGRIMGPVDVGESRPLLLDGLEATAWFAEHAAPMVAVV